MEKDKNTKTHLGKLHDLKAGSLSFGIVAIIKRVEIKQSIGKGFIHVSNLCSKKKEI